MKIKRKKKCIFTKKENDFLEKYYPEMGSKFCSRNINKTQNQIKKRVLRLGLKIKLENNGKIKSMGKTGIFSDKHIDLNNKYIVYLLGFIWGDGSLDRDRYGIYIKISSNDGNEISKILPLTNWKWINHDKKIKKNKFQAYSSTSDYFLHTFLKDNDYRIKSSTGNPQKILDKIPENLQHYWFRGFFDADGCMFVGKHAAEMSFASHYNQNWDFVTKLCNKLNIKKFAIRRRIKKDYGRHSSFDLTNKETIEKFFNYLYQNENADEIGYKRKYNKWLIIKKRILKFQLSKSSKYKGIYKSNTRKGKKIWHSHTYGTPHKDRKFIGWFETEEEAYKALIKYQESFL